MVKVIIEPSAKNDIKSIYRYIKYRLMSNQGAENFLQRTMKDIGRLAEAPTIGFIDEDFPGNSYRYIISHRRYRIYYILQDDKCHVLAIWDNLQNPQRLITFVVS